jgi:SAM-dependent methyltransferase
VSKAHDDPTRTSKDPTRGAGKAPADGKVVVEGATPRRVRSTGPRERSGPIGISSGDFSTPLVRKRTTTQPRGVPVLGNQAVAASSLDEPVKAAAPSLDEPVTTEPSPDFEDLPTPAPQPVAPEPAAVVGAMPSNSFEAIPVAMPVRPPPPPSADDSPFGGGGSPRADIDAEAAALAAEAAAVRALDSGPLTPPPEVVGAMPAPPGEAMPQETTPPPEVVPAPQASSPEVAAAPETPPPEVVARPQTPPPEVAAVRTPGPEITLTRTPPPEVVTTVSIPPPGPVAANRTPAPDITVTREPPPDLVAATRTPPPDGARVRTPLPSLSEDHSSPIAAAAAAAAAEADQITPPPEPKTAPELVGTFETTGALPGLAMQAGAGLASLPAVALSEVDGVGAQESSADGEVDGDEHLEVMEGEASPAEDDGEPTAAAQARSLRMPTLKNAAPPPIPGSHLRTPGPELLARAHPTGGTSGVALPPILPEALAQRPRRPKRSKPWFEEVFDEDYLRTLPFMSADQTLREVEFISDALRIGAGAEILDIACGYGRHAIELVQRGYNVTGLDLSLPLLLRAADESKRRSLSVNFVHADMREMAFEKQFDGAYSMLTSFGYFDEDTNLRVAERIGRALKPGARFLLDVVNRDYVVSDLPMRVWWEGTGCVVLEEVDFNFHTSRIVTHRSIVFEDGRQLEQEISVRAYSLHEIGRLLRQAGFRVMDVSGGLNTRGQFFGNASRSLLIVAEKRESDAAQPL